MIDEPEAVDVATQARISDEARRRDHVRRGWLEQQALDEQRSLADRVRVLEQQVALGRGGDAARDDLKVIAQRVVAGVRKVARHEDGEAA
jgi:hypothetical protein